MFYLYHIKGIKWGCTKNLEQRLKKQGYTLSNVSDIVLCENLDEAAKLELELNKKYSYKKQLTDYRYNTSEKASKAGMIGGKTQGQVNKKSGHIYNLGKNGDKIKKAIGGVNQSQNVHTCPHCNKIGKSNAMFLHHFHNCKLKPS